MAMRRRADPLHGAPQKYHPVRLGEISPNLQRAVLIGEDNRFYEHSGLDLVQIRMAIGYPRTTFSWDKPRDRADLWRAFRSIWSRREEVRGASTITQQLAKNLYLSPSRNPLRKLKELVITWRLEAALPKDRILELYLNTVELGPGIWGVEAASQAWFGHSARQLSDFEAATLAAILPTPLTSNPSYRPARMEWRRDHLLGRMRQGRASPLGKPPGAS